MFRSASQWQLASVSPSEPVQTLRQGYDPSGYRKMCSCPDIPSPADTSRPPRVSRAGSLRLPCITFETVVGLTPARSAISLILIIGSLPFLFLHNFLNSVMFILPRRQNVYNYFASANTTKLLHFLKRYVRKSPSLLQLLSAGSVVR